MKYFIFIYSILIITIIGPTNAWDTEELEIFDLVEEIITNFYDILGVQQDASLQEIKRAFRNLSIILHPDKSDAEDANIQFRNLVSVYSVLKDVSKREKYDNVLKNGLPNWKSALYYYRHVRKIRLTEMLLILFLIITCAQYIIAWAAYAEKRYTAESIFGSKLKKLQKKNKTNIQMDTIINTIPLPSIFNTLPFQIIRIIWYTPKNLMNSFTEFKQIRLEAKERKAEELERQAILEEALLKEKESRKEGIRKRKAKYAAKEKTDEELKGFSTLNAQNERNRGSGMKPVNAKESSSGGLWTDDDLNELVRLVKKYPGGTPTRWETIAEFMNRSVTEVTFMAAKLKESVYRVPGQVDSIAEQIVQETAKKIKAKRTTTENTISNTSATEANWSQEQQQLLETAIVKYPKTGASDRWQKIANNVPGKNKDECLARYKYLVEIVKSQKAKIQNDNEKEKQETVIEQNNENIGDEVEELSNDDNMELKMDDGKRKGKPINKRKERKKNMDFLDSFE